jgi:predicted TIM-barrel fold metal-dependent hydrolase
MRDGMLIVDGDGHVLEDLNDLRQRLKPEWARRDMLFPYDGYDRSVGGTLGKYTTNARMHLEDMDVEGIDLAVLYPTWTLTIGEIREREFAVDAARAYNDWLANYCSTAPARMKGVALLAVQDIEASCRELQRAVKELGFVAAMVPTWMKYKACSPGDSYYDPLYAECERLGVPVAFHATGGDRGEARLQSFLALHVFSHVPEQMLSLTGFILDGVLERFPRLTVGFMEAGCGWLPFWMEHMDGEYEKRPHEAPLLRMKPSEYIKSGRVYIGCEPEESLLGVAAQWIGEDQIVYASDYPHWDSDWPHTVSAIADRTDIGATLKRKVLGENALRMYGLKASVPAR